MKKQTIHPTPPTSPIKRPSFTATNVPPVAPEEKKEKAENPWLTHVKAFRAGHPELKFKEVLQQAKLTYVKKSK